MGSDPAGSVPGPGAISRAELQAFWNGHIAGIENKKNWIRSYDQQNQARHWLVEQVSESDTFLDVGCGPGLTYEMLARSGKDSGYLGIDIGTEFVQACQEMFPDGAFQPGDALQLDFPDNSFDIVHLGHVIEHTVNYQDPISEAVRVAKRKVIIVMWRPLLRSSAPESYKVHKNPALSNDYNAYHFVPFLERWLYPIEELAFLDQQRPNWAFVIHKKQDLCVFDLDDYYDRSGGIELLHALKEDYPELKVTLFGIPSKITALSRAITELDWVEIAVHGWSHEPNQEVLSWDADKAHVVLDRCEETGLFVKGFKAPGWQINQITMDVLKERGYWLACQPKQRVYARNIDLPIYVAEHHPLSVHGHMQDINQTHPQLRNGIAQLMYERGLPWDSRTKFKFVSEVVA